MDHNMNNAKAPLLEDDIPDSDDYSDMDGEGNVIYRPKTGINLRDTKRRSTKLSVKDNNPSQSKMVIYAIIAVFLLAFAVTVGIYLGVATRNNQLKKLKTMDWINGLGHGWSKVYEQYRNQAYLRLVDADKDGKLDIVLAMSKGDNDLYTQPKLVMRNLCPKLGELWPCGGLIVAIRGYDGKELWRVGVHHEVFNINCDTIDINGDGTMDCLCSGRYATFLAIDPTTGQVLWRWYSEHMNERHNVLFPLLMPDWNVDGVPELLICQGGDPDIESWDHNRPAARFMLVSGLTGRTIGPYMNTTDNKEMYMAPLLHKASDGNYYVIYGTGGETIGGSLYAIPRYQLRKFFMTDVKQTTEDTSYLNTWLPDKERGKHGEIEIFQSSHKGVSVTPLLVDVNDDGINDIMVICFDATLTLIDGKTLGIIWQKKFEGFESYSSPVPGYFNDDNVIDFMIQMSQGVWDKGYSKTQYFILDSRSGKTLWSKEVKGNVLQVTTPLMVRSAEGKFRDSFLFRTSGRPGQPGQVWTRGLKTESLVPQENQVVEHHHHKDRKKRHTSRNKTEELNHKLWCNNNSASFPQRAELFMFDRTIAENPVKLSDSGVLKYYYNITSEYQKYIERIKLIGRNKKLPEREPGEPQIGCIMGAVQEAVNGVIGDVDGDGKLDVIMNYAFVVGLQDWHYKEFSAIRFTRVIKTSLEEALSLNITPMTNITVDSDILKQAQTENKLSIDMFNAATKQPFAQFLGEHSASTYPSFSDNKR